MGRASGTQSDCDLRCIQSSVPGDPRCSVSVCVCVGGGLSGVWGVCVCVWGGGWCVGCVYVCVCVCVLVCTDQCLHTLHMLSLSGLAVLTCIFMSSNP